MKLPNTSSRPRPEDRRRADVEPAPVFEGSVLGLRSEAFAEDLPEPAATSPVPALRPRGLWHRLSLHRGPVDGAPRLAR